MKNGIIYRSIKFNLAVDTRQKFAYGILNFYRRKKNRY